MEQIAGTISKTPTGHSSALNTCLNGNLIQALKTHNGSNEVDIQLKGEFLGRLRETACVLKRPEVMRWFPRSKFEKMGYGF